MRLNLEAEKSNCDPLKSDGLLADVMSMNQKDINVRLAWIEEEIAQFSSVLGVTERVNKLRHAKAQLLSAKTIGSVMRK